MKRSYTTQSNYQAQQSLTPVSSAKQIISRIETAFSKRQTASCIVTGDIDSTDQVTVPAGAKLVLDLSGYTVDLSFVCVGELELRNGVVRTPITYRSGTIRAESIDFSQATQVVAGNVSDSFFLDCTYPSVFNTHANTVTRCDITGHRGDLDSSITIGNLYSSTVRLSGGIDGYAPVASLVEIDGYWFQSTSLGSESNIIARNVAIIPSIPSITSDGYAVLGRTGASSGTPVSIGANVGEVLIRDASTGLDFRTLTTSDISGLSTALTSSQTIPTKITTTNLTIDPAIYQDGYLFSNKGATTLITLTLPGAQVGRNYRFLVDGYTGMRIQATTGDNIVCGKVSSDDDGYIFSYNPTDVIHLYCQDSETWFDISNSNLSVNSVDNTILRDSAGYSVIGRNLGTTGDPADIIAGANNDILYRDSVGPSVKFGNPPIASISGLQTALDAKVDEFAGTDNALVRSDGTAGAMQNSTVIVSDLGEISGLRNTITTYTGAATLASSQSGTWIDNRGATSLVPITLPAPQSGLIYGFFVEEDDGLQVKVADSSGYYIQSEGQASVSSITSYDVGDALLLQGVGTEGWRAISVTGRPRIKQRNLTSNTTIQDRHYNCTFTNIGATSDITVTLPTAAEFQEYKFICDGYLMTVSVATGDYLIVDGYTYFAPASIELDYGDSIIITSYDSNMWKVLAIEEENDLLDGYIIVGSSTNRASKVKPSGVISISNTGNFQIVDGSIVTADLADDQITYAKMQEIPALTVIGNPTNGTANPTSITAATDGYFLGRSGTSIGFVPLPPSVTDHTLLTNIGTMSHDQLESSLNNKADKSALDGYQSKYSAAGLSVLGKPTSGAGVFSEIVAADDGYVLKYTGGQIKFAEHNSGVTDHTALTNIGTLTHVQLEAAINNKADISLLDGYLGEYLQDGYIFIGNASNVATGVLPSGDVTISNTGNIQIVSDSIVTADIANSQVTLAKIQNISSGVLLGRDSIGSGVVQQITPASPLEFTGSSGFRIATGGITSDHIANGTIVDADISQDALIDLSKLERLTAGRALVSDADGYISVSSTVSTTELGFLDGVTSAIQTQIDNKADKSALDGYLSKTLNDGQIFVGNASNIATGVTPSGDVTISNTGNMQIAAGAIINSDISQHALIGLSKFERLTANRALVSDADGYISVSSTVSTTELGFLDGVTSNVQTQLDSKASIASLDGYTLKATSSSDNAIVKFDGTSGRAIQNSGIIISDNNELTGHRRFVSDKTANYTITSAESGTVFTNRGASSRPKFTLPTMEAGQTFSFLSYESVGIEIEPASGDAISGLDGYTTNIYTGGTLILSTLNEAITLIGQNDGYMWLPINFVQDEIITNSNIVAGAGINLSKLESIAGLTVVCNPTSSTGVPTTITAGTDGYVLKRSGSTLAFLPDSTGAGGVSDGTYGDIIVSGSGTNWQINSAVITNSDISQDALIGLSKIQRLTAGRALVSDADGYISVSSTVSTTELEYLDGVTSAIQTQINGKEPTIAAGTTSQYWRGDKTWQTLDKSAVGLGNVDNTSDANKPISTATQTALDLKADKSALDGYLSKTLQDGYIFIGNGSNVATGVIPSGVISISNTGNFQIVDGSIVNADVNASAGITYSKFETISANSILGRSANTSGVAAPIQATVANTFLKYDGTDLVWSSTGAGTGDLVGPSSATNHALTRFDGTTGKIVKNSTVTLDNSGYISGMASITGKLNTDFYLTTQGTGVHKFYNDGFKKWEINSSGHFVGDDVTYSIVPRINNGSNSSGDVIYGCVADADTGIGFGGGSTNSIKFITGGANPFEITENALIGNDGYTYTPMVIGGTNSTITPVFTVFDDQNTGLGFGNDDTLKIITGSTNTFTFNSDSLIGNSLQTYVPKISMGVNATTSPVFGTTADATTGLNFDGYATIIVSNGSEDFRIGNSKIIGAYTGGATAATVQINEATDGSLPTYTFTQNQDCGLGYDTTPIMFAEGNAVQSWKSTGAYFDKPFRHPIGTSTSTSSINVDASVYQMFYWTASFGTGALTLSVDNLAAGNSIKIFCMNSHGSNEPALTVQASSTTSGHVSVKFMLDNGVANVDTGWSLPGASTWTCFEIFNINTNFVGRQD